MYLNAIIGNWSEEFINTISDFVILMMDNEDKSKPLTDDQLVAMMNEKGYKVARRTIAKYRNQLDIPKASQRKDI